MMLLAGPALAQTGQNVDWPLYLGDASGSKFKPLDQINASNFSKLEVAWRFKTDYMGNRPEYKLEGTPLEVGGVVYATAGSRRAVVALDAVTGELLWVHGEKEGPRGAAAPRQLSGRGPAYWSDGKEARILYVTPGYQLIALDAKTGQRVAGFGNNGAVDLKADDNQKISPDLTTGEIGWQSAPTVAGDVVLVGSAFREGFTPTSFKNNKGSARGFDVRTGKKLWQFNTIPQKGEPGAETWLNNSNEYTGNTGIWTEMTADPDAGLAYLPVEQPTADFYGGYRPGAGLYGNSLVAVDLKTGKVKWYFQLIHHEVWDYDMSSAPLLMDITVNGKPIKAVAAPSKMGFLYVFDRITGKPVWPIPERKVEKGTVPGEWYSPTQPIPTRPAAYARTGVSMDDLIDFTPGAASEGAGHREELQDGSDLHPAGGEPAAGPACDTQPRSRQWRHQLAGRLLQSGKPHRLSLRLQFLSAADGSGAAAAGPFRHALCRRRGGTEDRDGQCFGCRRGRRFRAGRQEAAAAAGQRLRRFRVDGERPAADQAALRDHQRHQSRSGRYRLAGRPWRLAQLHPQQSGAEGPQHPAHRPDQLQYRHAGDQEPGDRGRSPGHHHARSSARRAAACL